MIPLQVVPTVAVSASSVPRHLKFSPSESSEIYEDCECVHPCLDGTVLLQSTFHSIQHVAAEKGILALPELEECCEDPDPSLDAEACCVLDDGTIVYLALEQTDDGICLATYRAAITDRHLVKQRPLVPKRLTAQFDDASTFSTVCLFAVHNSCFEDCEPGETVPFLTFVSYGEDVGRNYFYLHNAKGRKPQWRRLPVSGGPLDTEDSILLACTGRYLVLQDSESVMALDLESLTWLSTTVNADFSLIEPCSCLPLLDGLLCFCSDSSSALVLRFADTITTWTVDCGIGLPGGQIICMVAEDEVQIHIASDDGCYATAFAADPLDVLRAARVPQSEVFLEALRRGLMPSLGIVGSIVSFEQLVDAYDELVDMYDDTLCSLEGANPRVALAAGAAVRSALPRRPLPDWESVHSDPIIRTIAGEFDKLPYELCVRDLLRHRAPESLNDLVYNRIYTLEPNYIATGCIPLRVTLDDLECPTAFRLLCRRAWRYSKHFSVEADGAKLFGLASCLTARDCSSVVGMKSTTSVRSSLYAGPGALVAEHSPVAFASIRSNTCFGSTVRLPERVLQCSGRALRTADGVLTSIDEDGVGMENHFCAALASDSIALRYGHGFVTFDHGGKCTVYTLDGEELRDIECETGRISQNSQSFGAFLGCMPVVVVVEKDDEGEVISIKIFAITSEKIFLLRRLDDIPEQLYYEGVFGGPKSLYIVGSEHERTVVILELLKDSDQPNYHHHPVHDIDSILVGATGVAIDSDYLQATPTGLVCRSKSDLLPTGAVLPCFLSRSQSEPSGFASIHHRSEVVSEMEPARPPLPYDAGSHPFLSALSSGALTRDGYGGHIRNELHVHRVFRELVQLFQSTFDPRASAPKSLSLTDQDLWVMHQEMEFFCPKPAEVIHKYASVDFTDVFRVKTAMLHGKAQALGMAHCARGIGNLGALLNLVIPHGKVLTATMRPYLCDLLNPVDTPFEDAMESATWSLWALVSGALAARAPPSARSSVVEHMLALASMPEVSSCLEPKSAIAWGSSYVLGPFGHDLAPHEAKRLARLRLLDEELSVPSELPPVPSTLSFCSSFTTDPAAGKPRSTSVSFLVMHSGQPFLLSEGGDYRSECFAMPLNIRGNKAKAGSNVPGQERLSWYPNVGRMICTPDYTIGKIAVSRRCLTDPMLCLPHVPDFTIIFAVQLGGEIRLVGEKHDWYGVISVPLRASTSISYGHTETISLTPMDGEIRQLEYNNGDLQTLPLAPGVALVVGASTSTVWRVDGASMAITAVEAPANCVYGDALLLGGVLAASKDHAYLLCDLDGEVVKKELAGWSLPSEPSAVCICASGDHYCALASTQEGITTLRLKK